MLTAADWLRMQAEAAQVRRDRSYDIELRRGAETLEPQEVRIEEVFTRGYRLQSDAAREARIAVVVFGDMDMNIAVDDRFTLNEVLYRVVWIAVNRDVDTQAEAVAVE